MSNSGICGGSAGEAVVGVLRRERKLQQFQRAAKPQVIKGRHLPRTSKKLRMLWGQYHSSNTHTTPSSLHPHTAHNTPDTTHNYNKNLITGRSVFFREQPPTPFRGVESCSLPSRRPNPMPAIQPYVVCEHHTSHVEFSQ